MRNASRIVPLTDGHHVWTRRVGESKTKMLLLHGGPGFNHEYLETFADHLPQHGVELYFYDQLGSYFSDQPDNPSLWNVDRFREEVEQVRSFLGLDSFYLCGQSWGGMLAIEYALHYPNAIKGLVISNMTASISAYVRSINRLRQQLPKDLLKLMEQYESVGDYEASAYQQVLMEHLYPQHLCRLNPWPEPVQRAFSHFNPQVYNTMQGPNEFLVTGNFKDWDRWADLYRLQMPTLLLVGQYDTMSVEDIEEMGQRIPNSHVTVCPNGSHMAMWDDPDIYFASLLHFIDSVETGSK
ncbi:alpha/beta fold hydrolase [Alicyclobacillaceae bacterium I2511]|nr:alpha/beta fold hydrolase [Alicyclobacillaceae bacterium I2511]